MTSSRELANWLEGLSSPPQYLKQSKGSYEDDGDLIRVTLEGRREEAHLVGRLLMAVRRRMAKFAEKYASFLEGLFRLPADLRTETFERYWFDLYAIVSSARVASCLGSCWERGYC